MAANLWPLLLPCLVPPPCFPLPFGPLGLTSPSSLSCTKNRKALGQHGFAHSAFSPELHHAGPNNQGGAWDRELGNGRRLGRPITAWAPGPEDRASHQSWEWGQEGTSRVLPGSWWWRSASTRRTALSMSMMSSARSRKIRSTRPIACRHAARSEAH